MELQNRIGFSEMDDNAIELKKNGEDETINEWERNTKINCDDE